MMSLLITLIVILIVFSIVWFIVNQIPVPPPFRWVVNLVIGLLFLIAVLALFFGGLPLVPLGHAGYVR